MKSGTMENGLDLLRNNVTAEFVRIARTDVITP